MHQVLHQHCEVSLCLVPVIVFITKLQFFIVRVEQSLPLAIVLPFFFQFVLDFLPFVPSYVYGVASLAPTVFAPISRQSSPPLQPRHLAQAALACFGESLHALPAAAVLHDELGRLQPLIGVEVVVIIVVLVQVWLQISRIYSVFVLFIWVILGGSALTFSEV